MNNYFLISIQDLGNTTAQAVFAYEAENEALSAYHNTLASNYVSEALQGFCVMVVNKCGVVLKSENHYEVVTEEE